MHDDQYHIPVLSQEILACLQPKPGMRFIDATLGGGGHTRLLADEGATVLGLDHDDEAIEHAATWLPEYPTVTVVKGSFEYIGDIAKSNGIGQVDGVLFDLGVASHQLAKAERGFSFLQDAPLDMRMDQSLQVTAKDLLNGLHEQELIALFEKLGEEHHSRRIARAIVTARKGQLITTTRELAGLVERTVGRTGRIHPATRVFQALRIAVNSELIALEQGLPQAFRLLQGGGKLVVISFHSLEDRIVKQLFNTYEEEGLATSESKKPVMASQAELAANPRSRSAKLRVVTKNETLYRKTSRAPSL